MHQLKRSPRQIVAVSVSMIVILGCSLFSRSAGGQSSGKRQVSHEPPTLPTAPKLLSASPGTPEEQAADFAGRLLASGDKDQRLAGWLGLYDALGVPVIGQDGVPLGNTGDDPIGPRYWQVWYASGLDLPGRGIRLSDAGRLIAAGLPGVDGTEVGPALLADLRGAAQSNNPQVRLMGLFVRERVLRGPSHEDISDAAVTPDVAVVDLPTVQLLSWIILREGLFQAASQASLPSGFTRVGYHRLPLRQLGSQLSCKDIPGAGTEAAAWVNWIANKLGGGFQLPGMQKAFPSLIERALGRVFQGSSEKFAERATELGGKVLGYTSVVTSAVSLILQLGAMQIKPTEDPNPLVRTKSSAYPGNDGVLELQLYSDPKSVPDGDELESCLASFFLNALGASFGFPSEGPIAGAEVSIEGAVGFPDLVMFNINGTSGRGQTMRADTDGNGVASFKVFGAPQKRDIPDSAKPVKKKFSVIVKAQPEEAGAGTMANIFFDGMSTFSGGGAPALLGGLMDVLKTFSYDMGESAFDLTDWGNAGYQTSWQGEGGNWSGVVCSLDQPFTVMFVSQDGSVQLPFKFSPTSADGGSFSFEGARSGISWSGTGAYTVQGTGTAQLSIVGQKEDTCYVAPGHQGCGAYSFSLPLTPLNTSECSKP